MKINRLILNNFRGIDDLDLEFSEKVTVIIGINGSGKSSILDAIAILLSKLIRKICSTEGTGRSFLEKDIMNGRKSTSNEVTINYKGFDYNWGLTKYRQFSKVQKIKNRYQLDEIASKIQHSIDEDENASVPLCVYYGVNRAVLDVPLRMRTKHDSSQLIAYDQALTDKRNDFRLFFEWFRDREDFENETMRDNKKFKDKELTAVRSAIEEFIGLSNLRVRRNPLRMEITKDKKVYDIRQMSDGEKCLLALIGDLARRIAIANPSLSDPLKGEGVILIDEIDLHLHPAWQRMVVPKLNNIFPNCQFIISTHSPLVLGEIEPENIRILSRGAQDNISFYKPNQSFGLSSNQIIDYLMKADQKTETLARNERIEEELTSIFKLIDNTQFEKAKKKIEKVKKQIHGSIPEIVKAEGLITMLEPEDGERT
jgi:predicted ATP-binding protein involved in virulence